MSVALKSTICISSGVRAEGKLLTEKREVLIPGRVDAVEIEYPAAFAQGRYRYACSEHDNVENDGNQHEEDWEHKRVVEAGIRDRPKNRCENQRYDLKHHISLE